MFSFWFPSLEAQAADNQGKDGYHHECEVRARVLFFLGTESGHEPSPSVVLMNATGESVACGRY